MTHRTVPRHLSLDMTGDAEPHPVHVVRLEHLGHALDIAMTGPARVGAKRLDMPLMREMGVPRQIMDPDPFNRLLLVPGLAQLLDLHLVRAVTATDHQVAAHAGLHRWDARLG